MQRIHVIDSHTAGEPTRLIVEGGPPLGGGSLAERRERMQRDYDHFRSAVVNEPRGSEVIVGGLVCAPADAGCAAGVIFFNNVAYLGMCGHGTVGLITTLAYQGKIGPGEHRIETPVGEVRARLHENGEVTVVNVPSYRLVAGVAVAVPGYRPVRGDIAWGGNWFFLVYESEVAVEARNLDALGAYAWAIRQGLEAAGITGERGAPIDHIELYGPAENADSRSYVLCPGRAYDRSPCGTGTSAKLACLYAAGKLAPGQVWRQESIIGTHFTGSIVPAPEVRAQAVLPSIRGSAYITGEGDLLLDDRDPFRHGIRL